MNFFCTPQEGGTVESTPTIKTGVIKGVETKVKARVLQESKWEPKSEAKL